jgi:hypothetical protein
MLLSAGETQPSVIPVPMKGAQTTTRSCGAWNAPILHSTPAVPVLPLDVPAPFADPVGLGPWAPLEQADLSQLTPFSCLARSPTPYATPHALFPPPSKKPFPIRIPSSPPFLPGLGADILHNAVLCVAYQLPPHEPHQPRLMPGTKPDEPILTEQDRPVVRH